MLYGKDASKVTFFNNELQVDNLAVFGIIQLAILCPPNLRNPVLLIKNKDGRSIAPTCYTCGFKSLKTARINACKHELSERAIRGTYCISEINYAMQLGYKIQKVFSICYFNESSNILSDFIALLGFHKLINSGFPSPNIDQQEYCNYLNTKMCLKNIGQLISPQNIKSNNLKREFFKLALNSFLGKFSQRNNMPITKLVRNEEEISNYFYGKTYEITDIFAINKHYCQIELKRKRQSTLPPSKNTNCILGACIVALSRQYMHEKMMELEKEGAKILYTDTDSLIFSLNKHKKMPLTMSTCFGDFKYEIDPNYEIQSYFSLGPKNFALLYIDNQGVYHKIIKLRGITLSNEVNKNLVNCDIYESFLKNIFNKKKQSLSVPTVRCKFSKFQKSRAKVFSKTFFSNSIRSKRIINKNCINFSSYPFGFCE